MSCMYMKLNIFVGDEKKKSELWRVEWCNPAGCKIYPWLDSKIALNLNYTLASLGLQT